MSCDVCVKRPISDILRAHRLHQFHHHLATQGVLVGLDSNLNNNLIEHRHLHLLAGDGDGEGEIVCVECMGITVERDQAFETKSRMISSLPRGHNRRVPGRGDSTHLLTKTARPFWNTLITKASSLIPLLLLPVASLSFCFPFKA